MLGITIRGEESKAEELFKLILGDWLDEWQRNPRESSGSAKGYYSLKFGHNQ